MNQTPLLDIQDLTVSVTGKIILEKFNLSINQGEIHAIMGPNGSGKSTLANVLARNHEYTVESGSIKFLGQDLLAMSVEECALAGVFLSFQYPVAIPGLANIQFLKASLNAHRKTQGLEPVDAVDFLQQVKSTMQKLGMKEELLSRPLNDGFSGGEKKRNEILQMTLLAPKLAILDETDSGLDIDALKAVAAGVNAMRDAQRSLLLITHYQRLLDYIEPDFVHVMDKGKIIHSGDKHLPKTLEQKGYAWLTETESSA